MSAFAQDNDPGTSDISSGNLAVVSDVPTVTAAKLSNLFGLFKGEWFRDQRVGVPYFQYVLVSNPDLGVIGNLFEEVALSAPGVSSVQGVQLDFTPRTRSLLATITAQTDEGVVLVGGPGTPFIVQPQVGGLS